MIKTCLKCKETKDINDFYMNKVNSDGHQCYCKLCFLALKTTKYKKVSNEYKRQWRKLHPQADRASCRRRRAMKYNIKEQYTTADEEYTKSLFGHACVNCGSTQNLCIDHHYPLALGNILSRQNAVVLCNLCNSRKKDKLPEDFYTTEKLQYIQEKLTAVNG